LKGRYALNTLTEQQQKSLEYFQRAIGKDPNFARAYAGMAESYAEMANLGATFILPPKEAYSRAKAAALKAVELDDTLAEAHVSLGKIAMNYEWDWNGAERELQRAIALNSNYVNAHHWYSHYLILMGRFDESLAESRRGLALDPLDVGMNFHLGFHFYCARQYDQAVEQLRKALEMDRNHGGAHGVLGLAYGRQGRYREAITEMLKEKDLGGVDNRGSLGHLYAISGRRDEAERMLAQLQEEARHKAISPYSIARIYAGLGKKDQAFVWLEKAFAERDGNFTNPGFKVDPELGGLSSDMRFASLLHRLGLP
jgi:tetratricopeptide (TPR) repeat protein